MRQLLFIAIILGFLSCEKETIESVSTSNMPKVVISDYGTMIDTTYIIYKGNQVESLKSSHEITTFEYQPNVTYQRMFLSNENTPHMYYKFVYNDSGKIKQMLAYRKNSDNSYYVQFSYTYDYLDNGIVKESYVFGIENTYSLLQFDIYGNLTVRNSYTYDTDQYIKSRIDSFKYDNKYHWFKNVNFPMYGASRSNVNNITWEKTKCWFKTYDYSTGNYIPDSTQTERTNHLEYNDFGYPISINNGMGTTYFKY